MRLHRFYVDPNLGKLEHSIWLRDDRILNQWLRVLRFREGEQVVLFDGVQNDRLYKITRIEPDAVQLNFVTDFERKLPAKHMYLFFSLLKKDKNDWVLQKCTELGVRNFVPILAERSEKTGFNKERSEKIVMEAAEQCGRSDIPDVREPVLLETALVEYKDKISLLVCDETLENNAATDAIKSFGIFVGPEGGWTEGELEQFKAASVGHFNLGILTLRAETAAVAAATKLL
ncbi:MAG: 16S rRNA (uracil(1498)-N(3))-methyltransferase [bacterium]|nr:16S rRNA (uracil(1498)-N(3))-methyltransferase [bacterium]